MPWLLSLALKLGVPARFGKAVVIGAGVILLLIAAVAMVKIHDHRVIAQHQAQQDAANAKADRKADAKAAEQRRSDDSRLATESLQLNRSSNNGQTDLDRRLGFQHCLGLQQRARAAKLVVPTCG